MGMWIELVIFVLVLVFGIWQLQDLKRERQKRAARKETGAAAGGAEPKSRPPQD